MRSLHLGTKQTFGDWVLIINEGGETVVIPISKKKWDELKNKFDLGQEG